MQIQYVSKYLALADEGLCAKMDCPFDEGLLLCNLDKDDSIYLYCTSCSYVKKIGISLYNQIVAAVNQSLNSIKKDGDIEYKEKEWNKSN